MFCHIQHPGGCVNTAMAISWHFAAPPHSTHQIIQELRGIFDLCTTGSEGCTSQVKAMQTQLHINKVKGRHACEHSQQDTSKSAHHAFGTPVIRERHSISMPLRTCCTLCSHRQSGSTAALQNKCGKNHHGGGHTVPQVAVQQPSGRARHKFITQRPPTHLHACGTSCESAPHATGHIQTTAPPKQRPS
jgi:hypothetical protein